MPPKKNESFKIELKCFLGEPDLPRELLGIIKSGLGMPNASGANQPDVFRCLLDWWRVFLQKAWQPLCEWNDHFVGDTTQSWKKRKKNSSRNEDPQQVQLQCPHLHLWRIIQNSGVGARGEEKQQKENNFMVWYQTYLETPKTYSWGLLCISTTQALPSIEQG